jgi:hypothetical protein
MKIEKGPLDPSVQSNQGVSRITLLDRSPRKDTQSPNPEQLIQELNDQLRRFGALREALARRLEPDPPAPPLRRVS